MKPRRLEQSAVLLSCGEREQLKYQICQKPDTGDLRGCAETEDIKAAKCIYLPENKAQQTVFLDKLYNLLEEEGLSTSVLRTIEENQK